MGLMVQKWKKESPISSPSSDTELVEESRQKRAPDLVEDQDEASEPEVSEAIAQVEASEVASRVRLPEGEAVEEAESQFKMKSLQRNHSGKI